MKYEELLKEIAKIHNTTPEEVDKDMREALLLAGYNISPSLIINLAVNKLKKDYIS